MNMLALSALATAVLAVMPGSTGAAQAQTKLVFSTYVPESYSVTACDAVFMDEVTKRTGGKIVFERYYASALLNAVDTVPGIGRGAADFGMGFPGGSNRGQYPISNIVMPYITDNVVAATNALNDLYKENAEFQAEYEKQNVKLLYSFITEAHSFWSREPIRTAADFKGKRVRSLLAIGDAVAKLGGTPVAMAFPDGLEAINRGAIDVFGNAPFDLGVTAGLHKVTEYASDGGRMGVFAASASVINLKRWKSLPPDVQQIMLEVAAEMPKCYFEVAKRDIEKAVETLGESKQVEVITFSPEESKKLRETVGRELRKEWVTLVTKHGYNGQRLLDRYLELVAKYEKEHPWQTGFDLYKAKYGK